MSTNKHIEEVVTTWATYLADADDNQDGFITDHTYSMAVRDGSNYYEYQPNRYWNGAAWVYYDVTYDDITANGILYATEYIHHLGDTSADTYIRFQEDHITLTAGGVDFLDLVEDTVDYAKFGVNVGVGVTPEAWSSTYAALQVGSSLGIMSNATLAAGNASFLMHNVYYDGAWKRTVDDEYSLMQFVNGTTRWYTGAAGTADVDLGSLTERMQLDANGQLGIGVTPTCLLHVLKDQNAGTVVTLKNANNHVDAYTQIVAGADASNAIALYSASTLCTALDGGAAGIGGAGKGILSCGNVNGMLINNSSNTPLYLATNNVVRMTISAGGVINIAAMATGTDNSVVCYDASGNLVTDEIDSRVWGATLLDGGGALTQYYVPLANSASALINSIITQQSSKVGIGLGATAPGSLLSLYSNDTIDMAVADGVGLNIEQDSTGDAALGFELTGGQRYSIGIDNSRTNDPLTIQDVTNSTVLLSWYTNTASFSEQGDIDIEFKATNGVGGITTIAAFDWGLGCLHFYTSMDLVFGANAASPDFGISSDGTNVIMHGTDTAFPTTAGGAGAMRVYVTNLGVLMYG